jgi:hypothetical protein
MSLAEHAKDTEARIEQKATKTTKNREKWMPLAEHSEERAGRRQLQAGRDHGP